MNTSEYSSTKIKIFNAFSALVEKKSFSSIRVTAIVQESKVSQQTFYRCFQNKYDLAVDFFCDQLICAVTVGGKNVSMRDAMFFILSIIKNNAKMYANLLCDEEGAKLLPEILTKLSKRWTGFSPAWATTIINTNILINWAASRFSMSIEEVYSRFINSLPAYELLSEHELNTRIREYESLKSHEFQNRKHKTIHK